MLVVEDRIENDEAMTHPRGFNIEEFIWPHGITPPLHHVRKRRFRKRINKRVGSIIKCALRELNVGRKTIETVEQEVERLLEADNMASEVKYGTPSPGTQKSNTLTLIKSRGPRECKSRSIRLRVHRA